MMKRIAALLLLCLGASPAMGISGELRTMPLGRYVCEVPGTGLGPASLHVPEADFSILRASRYRTPEGVGIYMLVGDLLIMTSGPRQGDRYIRKTRGFLRMMDSEGEESRLRCVLQTRNNR